MAKRTGGFIGQDGINAPDPATGVSASGGDAQATVSFTSPSDVGGAAITGYNVQSNDGIGASGSASPVTITGLTNDTSYTFKVRAINAFGWSSPSDASGSVTPSAPLQIEYTTPGTYSWVCPTGVTSVSVVCVGGGGSGSSAYGAGGGGGGGLGYKNSFSVTPGNSYTVVVGAGGGGTTGTTTTGFAGQDSYFNSNSTARGLGGAPGTTSGNVGTGGAGGGFVGDGGGSGGDGGGYSGNGSGAGGGAGGYSGAGGRGGSQNGFSPFATSGSGGGGGGGGASGAGGGGVGLLGEGTSGSGGSTNGSSVGTGGSGGADGDNGDNNRGEKGGSYGGGGGGGYAGIETFDNNGGAVRILYMTSETSTRSFPSTNTGDL